MGVEDMELDSPDSSDQTIDTDAASTDTSAPEPNANSSSASEGEKRDLLSVVRDAARPENGDSAPPAGQDNSGQAEQASRAEGDKQAPPGPDDENFTDVPFHKHPRMKQLIEQRNQFRQGAEQYGRMQEFLQTNNVGAEEAADALILAALIKTDPDKAWAQLKPVVQDLLQRTGHVLPPDLMANVKAGKMSKEVALEVSRSRAAVANAQGQAQIRQTQTEREMQVRQVNSIREAVGSWESQTLTRDPDFAAMQVAVQKELAWIHRNEGVANTPQAAVAQVQRAYDEVRKNSRPAQQRPQKRGMPQGRVSGGQPTLAPKSILEIVQSAGSSG